jgi:adhesin transport system membrane fusion protein
VFISELIPTSFIKEGKAFGITPGMVATVDIRTGEKTVLDYLLKPFNKAKEALRKMKKAPKFGAFL